MSISKLKSLVIAVLAVINVFFLTDIVWQRVSYASKRVRMVESLSTVLEGSGITLRDGAIGDIAPLGAFSTSQDAYAEAAIARAILGDCEPVQSVAGQSQRYEGGLGSAVFYTRGDFVIELTKARPVSGTSKSATRRLLRSMDIDTDEISVTSFGGTDIVTSLCIWRGDPIFNCTVTFEFSGGNLLRVMGRRPSAIAEAPSKPSVDLPTSALAVLRYILSNEIGCTEISSVQPGYRMNTSNFGEGELTPGWLFVTDSGSYFADAVNGEITRNDA